MGGRGRAVQLHSLFVQDSACHINRYEYWMRAERCCARHSQGSTLQIKLFPPFIKLTIKQLMVQTSCGDLFRLDVFNKLSRCKMVALTNCWLDKSSSDKNMCQIGWDNKRPCLTYCFSLTGPYLCVCLPPASLSLPLLFLFPPLRPGGEAGQQMAGPYPSAGDEWRMMSSRV